MEIPGTKRAGSPGNPVPPEAKRANSVRHSDSELEPAADLVSDFHPLLPRSSTPLVPDLSRDPRAPQVPRSPLPEVVAEESEEEDLFYNPNSEDEGEPDGPASVNTEQVDDLSQLFAAHLQPERRPSLVRPPILQPPPDLAANMARADQVPPAEISVRMEIQNSMEEAGVFIKAEIHAAATAAREASGAEAEARQKTRFRKASRSLREAEDELDKLKKKTSDRIAKIANVQVREASRVEWIGYRINAVNMIEDLRDELIAADPSKMTEAEQVNASVNASKDVITQHVLRIKDALDQVTTDLNSYTGDDSVLNKERYAEAGDEEILLLDVARDGGEAGWTEQLGVGQPGAGDPQPLAVSEGETVQQGRLAGPTGPHDGEDLARPGHSAHPVQDGSGWSGLPSNQATTPPS